MMEVDDCIMHDNEMQAEQEMVKDMPKAEEEHDKSIEMPKEKMEGHEGSEIVIGKEEYLVCTRNLFRIGTQPILVLGWNSYCSVLEKGLSPPP